MCLLCNHGAAISESAAEMASVINRTTMLASWTTRSIPQFHVCTGEFLRLTLRRIATERPCVAVG